MQLTDGNRKGTVENPTDIHAAEVRRTLGVHEWTTDELVEVVGEPTVLTGVAVQSGVQATGEWDVVLVRVVGLWLKGGVINHPP